MRWMPLALVVAGLLAGPAAAESSPLPERAAIAARDDVQAARALVRLDQRLTQAQRARENGSLAPERYAEFAANFRMELGAAYAAAAPSAENAALHTRILSRLGESGPAATGASAPSHQSLTKADSAATRSKAHFSGITMPAVLAAENAGFGNTVAGENSVVAAPSASAPRSARSGFAEVSRRVATNILANLPTPPAPLNDGQAPTPAHAAGLAISAALGAAGAMLLFGGWGSGELEKRQPGIKIRMGMAAAVGTVIATGGFMFLPAAPIVAQEQPQMTSAAEELQPYVVDQGKILNRVWHSNWKSVDGASGPDGSSFCEGACTPINAQSAIERRGLNIPGLQNDAQHGGLFEAMERIPARIRTAIDGDEVEILVEKRYLHLLKYIPESHSQLPPGGPK